MTLPEATGPQADAGTHLGVLGQEGPEVWNQGSLKFHFSQTLLLMTVS